jgi:spoIIIJ-associated protein
MDRGKDFYGQEVTTIIEEACREFRVSQEELDIEVIETGSAGIFGLCKKKAHIRAQKKQQGTGAGKKKGKASAQSSVQAEEPVVKEKEQHPRVTEKKQKNQLSQKKEEESPSVDKNKSQGGKSTKVKEQKRKTVSAEPVAPPTEEALAEVKKVVHRLLDLMGYPFDVTLAVENETLKCHLSGEHEEALVGNDGRTLDSMQYLLRKMVSGHLPDRMMLALDAGDFRRRRAEELKERALQLAVEVRETGKTQAIPALNPAERRVVHMILQEDKTIRSRSVGDGLFKKILIYKPGKGNKSSSRKRRGRQGGRSSEN